MIYEDNDPYAFLAWDVISRLTNAEINRFIVDDDFVFRMLKKEVRGLDLQGPFIDCVIDNILRDKERMELMEELDKLSEYLFNKLDIAKLRNKILEYCSLYNIM